MLIFRTLKYFILSSLVLLGLSISVANASLVYNVDRTVGTGSVSGFIETDGTLGSLETKNITDWKLTLTVLGLAGSTSDTIEFGLQSRHIINGQATKATATQLWFDFGLIESTNFLYFEGTNPKNFWCLETKTCTSQSPTETIGLQDSKSQVTRSGQIAFAQVSAIPVPATVWLFSTALIGLAGFGKRRKTV